MAKRKSELPSPPHPVTPSPRHFAANIPEDLAPLAVALDQLHPDPKNVKRHAAADLAAVKASLQRYGQAKPIVVDRDSGRILAGHGVYAAAKALGWTHLAAVRVAYDPTDQRGFMIADNRTSDLSAWDPAALEAALAEMGDAEAIFLAGFKGVFSLDELAAEMAGKSNDKSPDLKVVGGDDENGAAPENGTDPAAPQLGAVEYRIIVICKDEAEQAGFLAEFDDRGIECRALVT